MRNCGNCNACCTSIPIVEPTFKKPYGQLCACWIQGARCSVYSNRPKPCKDFYCDWLKGMVGGNKCRPDRLGVIFDTAIEAPQGRTLQVWEHEEKALQKPFVREYMKRTLKRGWFIVTWDRESKKRLYVPEGRAENDIEFEGEVLPGSAL